jgi:DNA-binding transcriptional MerR regulator
MENNGHSETDIPTADMPPPIPAKDLFRIGEVSRLTSTKPFVLRFWETEFPMLQPVKSPKGHRLYRRQDIDTVLVIKRLLYDEGFTIAGARRHLRDQDGEPSVASGGSETLPARPHFLQDAQNQRERLSAPEPSDARPVVKLDRQTLLDLRDSLRSLLTVLEGE